MLLAAQRDDDQILKFTNDGKFVTQIAAPRKAKETRTPRTQFAGRRDGKSEDE